MCIFAISLLSPLWKCLIYQRVNKDMPSSSGEEVYRSENCTLLVCCYISSLTGAWSFDCAKLKLFIPLHPKITYLRQLFLKLVKECHRKRDLRIENSIISPLIVMRPFIWSNANTVWLTSFLLFWRVYYNVAYLWLRWARTKS